MALAVSTSYLMGAANLQILVVEADYDGVSGDDVVPKFHLLDQLL